MFGFWLGQNRPPLYIMVIGGYMSYKILLGILLPFFGTSLGASAVFFLKKGLNSSLSDILNGFASGVMFAASIWSLLIPSIEQASSPFTSVIGFLVGFFFLSLLDKTVVSICSNKSTAKLPSSTFLLILAVALHNLPEGVAVGVVFAEARLSGDPSLFAAAVAFSVGITIQNLPEGAIISCPLYATGVSRFKSFSLGALSGAVEPLGATLALICVGFAVTILPFLLSFTAGAMIFVTIKNLIPEFTKDNKLLGTLFFSFGFSIMMLLDISL